MCDDVPPSLERCPCSIRRRSWSTLWRIDITADVVKGGGRALKIPAEGVETPSMRARAFAMATLNLGSPPRLLGRGIVSELIGPGSGPNTGAFGTSSGMFGSGALDEEEGAGKGRNKAASIRSSASKSTRARVWSRPFDLEDKDGTDPPLCDHRDIARVVTISKTHRLPSPTHDTKTRKKGKKHKKDQSLKKGHNWPEKH